MVSFTDVSDRMCHIIDAWNSTQYKTKSFPTVCPSVRLNLLKLRNGFQCGFHQ